MAFSEEHQGPNHLPELRKGMGTNMAPLEDALKGTCECGEPKPYRKHYCSACSVKRIAERNKRENRAKADSRKGPGRAIGVSGYPGVYKSTKSDAWTGEVRRNGQRINIGTWPTPKLAYEARLDIYFSVFGEYPNDSTAPKGSNKEIAGEANTPLQRYDRVLQYLINIA